MPYKLLSKYLPENFSVYEHKYYDDCLEVYVPMKHTDSDGETTIVTKTLSIEIEDNERWAITQAKVNDAILEEIS
jgi:hypothetical protein